VTTLGATAQGRLGALLLGLRLPFLTGSVLPVWAAASLASHQYPVAMLDLLLTTLAVAALHLASNLANDAADSDNTDRINRFRTPFSGGSHVLLDGTLSRRGLWLVVGMLVATALAAGAALTLRGRPLVWPLGAAGGLIGLTYSLSGLRLMARGWGEAAVFVSFGPLLTLSAGYAVAGSLDPTQLALGALPGFLITAILWINQFPDRQADAAAGKRNLVVRMRPDHARLAYVALMAGPFITGPALVGLGVLPAASLSLLLALPVAARASFQLLRAPEDPRAVLPVQGLTILTHALLCLLLIAGLSLAGSA
jgi:1,4-dihydroxy-2-naphthoate octaprenyltransferase